MTASTGNLPLFVDLDGTLIKADVSYESFLMLLKKNPLNLFCAVVWLLRGRPFLKKKISETVELDAKTMPYNKEFLNFLKEEKQKGRKIILASASEKKFVERVAAETSLFDHVIATDSGLNMSGRNKAEAIEDFCRTKSWNEGWSYAGNSSVDYAVWRAAKEPILVTDDTIFAKAAEKKFKFAHKFVSGGQLRALIKSLRPHQWMKNLLLFVPMIMAHKIGERAVVLDTFFAFVAFSVSASAIYLVNDLLDIEADRLHRTKKNRPLASGSLQVRTALLLIPLLLGTSVLFSMLLPYQFSLCLAAYLLTTISYSFYLKRLPVLDIIILAMLYVLRIFAGSLSTGVYVSQWMISFSLFAFTSLACLKRFSELVVVKSENFEKVVGRGYEVSDMEPISQFGTASGYLSVFVLVFYINSKEVLALYKNPGVLWFLCPLILYWITRIWIYAYRGKVDDDPVVFALKDRVSYFIGVVIAALLIAAA